MGNYGLVISYMLDAIIFFSYMRQNNHTRLKPWLTLILVLIMRLIFIGIIMPFNDNVYARMPFAAVTTFIMAVIFFKGKLIEQIANMSFFLIVCFLSEIFVFIIFSAIGMESAFTTESTTERMYLMTVDYFMIFLLSHIAAYFRKRKKVTYSGAQSLFLFVSSAILMVELELLGGIAIYQHDIKAVLYGALFGILGTVTVIFLIKYITNVALTQEEREYKAKRLELYNEQYVELHYRYENLRRIKHDYNNHLQTLVILCERENNEDLDNYIDELIYKLNK